MMGERWEDLRLGSNPRELFSWEIFMKSMNHEQSEIDLRRIEGVLDDCFEEKPD